MAKLKARGRQEIFRMTRERETPTDKQVSSEKVQVALMSDGNVLKRRVIRWRPEMDMGTQHDYGWKVTGKIKPGLTAEQALEIYLKAGYALEGSSPEYLIRRGNMISDVSNVPLRTAAQAEKQLDARKKHETKAKLGKYETLAKKKGRDDRGDGPGLYVTNGKLMGSMLSDVTRGRVAELGPYESMDDAEEAAWRRFDEFRSMSFDYLRPVKIIESPNRASAERDQGHVWWIDGRRKGPPVDPRQLGFHNGF
jgi:hypothetical protein